MNRMIGIIFAIMSSSAFGIMPVFAKIAYNDGSNATTALAFRFSLAALMLYIYGKFKKVDFRVSKEQLKFLALVGTLSYPLTTETLFLSYNYMGTGLATTIHFVYPASVCILMYIIYKEKFSKIRIMALMLSCIGVYMLVGLNSKGLNVIGVILALFSGVAYSTSIVAINNKKIRDLDTKVMTFYFCLFAGTVFFLVGGVTNQITFKFNFTTMGSFLEISLISTIVSTLLLIKAIRIIGTSISAILGTFEPIVSIIFGVLFFKEPLTFPIIIGTVLILVSVFILASEKGEAKEIKNHQTQKA